MTSKVPITEEAKDLRINFCIKCFKGHLCINYYKNRWGLKCDSCKFVISICQGAASIKRVDDETKKCEECNSYQMTVMYKDNSPFPGKQLSHTACILCDSWLRGTIHNHLARQAAKLMTDAEVEEANRIKEERKKAKEEKKKQREEEEAKNPNGAQDE